jgi:regulator of protease activity HflC (stomatin/prohibitin superfamily)
MADQKSFHASTPPPLRGAGGPMRMPPGRPGKLRVLLTIVAGLAVIYGAYFWLVRRVVVERDHVLVLTRKNGTRSLPGDQIIIPRPPADHESDAYRQWEREYGDCNGILEQVFPEGTYFGFSPFDYEREVIDISQTAIVPNGKVGVVVRRFGAPLPAGRVLAGDGQRGPLPGVLQPARYNDFANPYAYEMKVVDPVRVDPGHRGVVTVMAGRPAKSANGYLVGDGEQGVQQTTEPEGFRYVNPFEKRITPITIQSQRYEMKGPEAIRFPSSDSFDITMEGFVEWSIIPDRVPLIYVQYSEGGELVPFMEEKVILPYARSYCRLVGSQYAARQFISGDTKLKFQKEFETLLRERCKEQGIEILQALVRDIIPPDDIKNPINEREIAKQQILSYEQQIKVAASAAKLATQTETANQNSAIGDENKKMVSVMKKAEQERDVAVTLANQQLAVAKLKLEAAQKQADALVVRGKAEAAVVLLNKQAEAEPLRQQVQAFGDGEAYARYFFYQKTAPSIKSILTNTDGPFADLFRQFAAPPADAAARPAGETTPAARVPAASSSPADAEKQKVSNVREAH